MNNQITYQNPQVVITAKNGTYVIREPKIAVIIPTKNEACGIGQLIKHLYDRHIDQEHGYQVIVIDGNSSDGTPEIAHECGAKVVHGKGKGKGYDLRLFQGDIRTHPQDHDFDIFVMIDGDGSYRPEDIERLIKPIKKGEADVVIGSRLDRIKPEPGSIKKLNRFGNHLLALVAKVLYRRIDLTDVTSGYWVFSKHFLNNASLSAEGWDLEINLLHASKNYRLKVVPIGYKPRIGYSKLNPLNYLKFPLYLVKYFALGR